MTSESPTTTSNDESSPTTAAAWVHHLNSTNHDTRLPASASSGSDTLALSMNSAALRIASSSAMPHRPAIATRASAKYINSTSPSSSTMPGPAAGSSGVPRRLAMCGTPRYNSANARYVISADGKVSVVRYFDDHAASVASAKKAAMK